MGALMTILKRKAVWLTALCLFAGQGLVQAQTSNLAFQVANMAEDLRILDESIRSMRVELDRMRRENNQLREQVSNYEARIGNSMNQLATIGQVNQAVAKAVALLEARDEKMKNEIVLKVNREITEFANSVQKSIGGLPAAAAKPDPSLRTSFPKNFPNTGTPYIVRSGDTLSSIAKKFGSSIDWVQNANEIASPRHLQAGRKLFIPHN